MTKFNKNYSNKVFYGEKYFDINRRLKILQNNPTFFLNDGELEELITKKCTFGSKRNLSFRQYIKSSYEDFKDKLEYQIKNLTSLDAKSDVIYLWGNYHRVLEKTIGIENTLDDDGTKQRYYKNNYNKDIITNTEELIDILENEYLLFDLETTGLNELNQIIEFGGIIYNRKIFNNIERIKEAQSIKTDKILVGLLKYFNTQYLLNQGFNIFEDISKYAKLHNFTSELNNKDILTLSNTEDKQKKMIEKHIKEYRIISNKLDFSESTINKEEFLNKILNLTNFELKYNKQFHFYIEHYKDYSNSFNENIHHITNEKRTETGKNVDITLKAFTKLFNNQIVLAHNINFDIGKIAQFFNDFKIKGPKIKKVVDTIDIFQYINKIINIGNKISFYNLDYLSKLYLGLNLKANISGNEDRHTAIYDVKLTHRNIEKAKYVLYEYLKDNKTPLIDELLTNIGKGEVIKKDKLNKKLSKGQISIF